VNHEASVEGITWEGYDWLGAVRSETVWSKTLARFRDNGVEGTIELVKAVAVEIVKELVLPK
jgi:hypothetical protein